jgi:beta-glucanase (GH16 family)
VPLGSSSGGGEGLTTGSTGGTTGSTGGTTGSTGAISTGFTPDGLLPDAGYTLIFDDELDALSLMPTGDCNWGSSPPGICDGGGTWLPVYTWDNRTLSGNDEAEIYVDPTYAGSGSGCDTPLGINPFDIDAGILTLQANPTPTADLPCLMSLPYTSGTIISYPSFTTTYGFFETRAKLPAGQGLWPAFWLLDENLQWPPEIDIFEFIGGQYTTLEMHTHDSNSAYAFGATSTVPDVSLDFHVYGLDWEADTITWYFDGVQQAQTATAPDLDQPMYILLNLAVGGTGSWPGPTNSSTVFPANMQVDYVRVWQKP